LNYQQASRNFIAAQDQAANEVRAVLRELEFSRLSFQIARQQVVAAARQVDQAQIDLRRSSQADSNLTIVLLQALEGMLDAKNSLIVNWVEFRVQKMRLFAALDMLYLDQFGTWVNEDTGLEVIEGLRAIDPQYFPPQWAPPQELNNQLKLPADPVSDIPELIESPLEEFELLPPGN
jgi:hypothetical protein